MPLIQACEYAHAAICMGEHTKAARGRCNGMLIHAKLRMEWWADGQRRSATGLTGTHIYTRVHILIQCIFPFLLLHFVPFSLTELLIFPFVLRSFRTCLPSLSLFEPHYFLLFHHHTILLYFSFFFFFRYQQCLSCHVEWRL